MAKQEILTANHLALLAEFASDKVLAQRFYLTGGTALAAFYLHHRRSDDLDFFSATKVSLVDVTPFIKHVQKKLNLGEARYDRMHDRHMFIFETPAGELKIEFTHYPFESIGKKKRVSGVAIDSLKDIAVNKLFAAFDRNEPKDLIDLAFLLQEKFSLSALQAGVRKKFGLTVEKLMLAELFHRGSTVAFIEPYLLRGDLTQIHDFYRDLLTKSGRQILS